MSNLVSSLAHELFGRFFPDGWHRDDPADVLVHYACLRLVGQLLQRVVPEEPQRMREDGQRLDRLTVAGRQFCVGVEVLKRMQNVLHCNSLYDTSCVRLFAFNAAQDHKQVMFAQQSLQTKLSWRRYGSVS